MAEAEDVVGFHVFRMQRYNKFFIPARGEKEDGKTKLPCRQRIDGISPWSRRNLAVEPTESRQDADEISPRSRWNLADETMQYRRSVNANASFYKDGRRC
jgi:hypothetical protein